MFMAGLMAQRLLGPTGIIVVGSESVAYRGMGNFTCPMPAGAASGDLVICLLAAPQLGDNNMICNTSGFTEIYDQYTQAADGFFGVNAAAYMQLYGSTPPSTVSFKGITSQAENHAQVIVFRGVNSTTPVSVLIGSLVRSNQCSGLPANNAASHPANSVMLMVTTSACFYGSGSVDTELDAPSGGATLLKSRVNNYSGRIGGLSSAYYLHASGGSFNAQILGLGTFDTVYNSGTSECSRAFTIAIHPA